MPNESTASIVNAIIMLMNTLPSRLLEGMVHIVLIGNYMKKTVNDELSI